MGNGIEDDTKAVQGAIDAAIIKTRGDGVFISASTHRISTTSHIQNVLGLKISSVSIGATRLIWDRPPDATMFLMRDARDVVMCDFYIESTPANPLFTAIQLENGLGTFYAPSQNHFWRLIINGSDKGGKTNGFRLAKGAGSDNNNNFYEFIRCQVRNYQGDGFSVEHSQSHTNRFYSCTFSRYGFGLAGIRTTYGSFSWFDGGGGNSISDFSLGPANVTIFIINGDFEDSKRLLVTSGPTGARWPTRMQGKRFASDNFPDDGIMLDVENPGPLILKNNLVGTDLKAKMPRVRMNTTQHSAKFICQGNLWRGLDANDTLPYLFAGSDSTPVQANIAGDAFVSGHDQKDLTRFTGGDMAPTLRFKTFYKTNNSEPTIISNFRNGWPGQKLDILIEDSYTGFDFKTGTLSQNSGRLWRGIKRRQP